MVSACSPHLYRPNKTPKQKQKKKNAATFCDSKHISGPLALHVSLRARAVFPDTHLLVVPLSSILKGPKGRMVPLQLYQQAPPDRQIAQPSREPLAQQQPVEVC